jgi:hypothetical protein
MISLTEVKRFPQAHRDLSGFFVRIFSREHGAYWRAKYSGYTHYREDAGIYLFEDAFKHTSHCGPEKAICYEVAEPDYSI